MKLKEKYLAMYRSDKVLLAEWITAVVTGVFVFLCSSTWDLQSLTIWSTNVWDCLFDGNLRGLYAFTAQNLHHAHHAHMGSELMSVLPWSIWNIPIWIMQRFFGRSIMDSPVMLAYSKLFLVAVTAIMLIYAKKITAAVTGSKNKGVWVMYLTASSVFLYLSVCYSGQNDILMMTASVIGIYCLLQNKRRAFMLWTILAIAIKPFFLLPFLAVLLLAEKNVLKILLKILIAVSGLVVQKLFFIGAPGYQESMSSGPSVEMLEEMFPSNLNTNFGGVSFFAVAMVLIVFYSYTRDFTKADYADSRGLLAKYTVYMITVTYTCYLMFSPFSFYRLATLTPFLFIVLVQNDEMRFFNTVFETALETSLLLRMILRGSNLFRIDFINKAFVQRIFGYHVKCVEGDMYYGVDSFLEQKIPLLEKYQPMFSGVAVVSAVALLALNHPERRVRLKVGGDKNARALLWVRALLMLPFVALSLYLFAKTANIV